MWIAIAAALLFVPGLGSVHLFDRDEINFAEIAREMLVTGQWSQPSVGFRPFYEKPPLFMWLQAVSMTLFGVGEFAARLPNALCGALTLVSLYRIGAGVRGRTFWSRRILQRTSAQRPPARRARLPGCGPSKTSSAR